MRLSVVYLNRHCPRSCSYCRIKEGLRGTPLTVDQWTEAFPIIRSVSDFIIVLGNEPWLFGDDLLKIVGYQPKDVAVYTSGQRQLFHKWREVLVPGLMNYSIGIDYPRKGVDFTNDMVQKSAEGWEALEWIREHYPECQCHATVTVSAANEGLIDDVMRDLSRMGVYINVNAVHWDRGGFDFFPPEKEMKDFMLRPRAQQVVASRLRLHAIDPLFQNGVSWVTHNLHELFEMGWHCGGVPYEGVTVDADGSLRCCGYRQGQRCPSLNVWSLTTRAGRSEARLRRYRDARDCKGCSWSCPMLVSDYHRLGMPDTALDAVVRQHERSI